MKPSRRSGRKVEGSGASSFCAGHSYCLGWLQMNSDESELFNHGSEWGLLPECLWNRNRCTVCRALHYFALSNHWSWLLSKKSQLGLYVSMCFHAIRVARRIEDNRSTYFVPQVLRIGTLCTVLVSEKQSSTLIYRRISIVWKLPTSHKAGDW